MHLGQTSRPSYTQCYFSVSVMSLFEHFLKISFLTFFLYVSVYRCVSCTFSFIVCFIKTGERDRDAEKETEREDMKLNELGKGEDMVVVGGEEVVMRINCLKIIFNNNSS